jgi:hypothetical protein
MARIVMKTLGDDFVEVRAFFALRDGPERRSPKLVNSIAFARRMNGPETGELPSLSSVCRERISRQRVLCGPSPITPSRATV